MKPIAIFYHALFFAGDPPTYLPNATKIIKEQMTQLAFVGLDKSASHFLIGVNGGEESLPWIKATLPSQAQIILHGLDCRNENKTIVEMENWVATHPDWYVLYFHAKGSTQKEGDPLRTNWRNCMMKNLILKWRQCVKDLDRGFESVGCHWMTGMADGSQNIWAGNFWWANSSFLHTLPSITARARIKMSGIGNIESRYESEVWIGNGPRLPRVKDYCPGFSPTRGQCP